MASIRKTTDKDGNIIYKVQVSAGRGRRITRSWRPAETWSAKTIEKELSKFAANLEKQFSDGAVLTKQEEAEKARAAALEAAKLRTVRQYADGVFMPAKEATFSENARASYRMFLDKHILPVLGNLLLTDVTPAMISKLLIDFQKAGYAHASAVKLYNVLNGFFDMAFMDESIRISPMLKVKRPAPRKDEAPKEESDKALTAEELARVLSCVGQEPLKWQAYINLAADSAARRGELCGLQWSDIDWRNGTITIRRNLQYSPQKGVYVAATKNGKSRIVDVGAETLDLLRRLREEQATSCVSKWVFTQDGIPEPMFPQSPTRYFKKFGERYGVEGFHPHKLRHSSASIAITNGADVVSVSQRLGHSDTAVTLRMYAHANDESIRRAGQTVRDALKAHNE